MPIVSLFLYGFSKVNNYLLRSWCELWLYRKYEDRVRTAWKVEVSSAQRRLFYLLMYPPDSTPEAAHLQLIGKWKIFLIKTRNVKLLQNRSLVNSPWPWDRGCFLGSWFLGAQGLYYGNLYRLPGYRLYWYSFLMKHCSLFGQH